MELRVLTVSGHLQPYRLCRNRGGQFKRGDTVLVMLVSGKEGADDAVFLLVSNEGNLRWKYVRGPNARAGLLNRPWSQFVFTTYRPPYPL